MTGGTGEKGLAPFHISQVQWQPENDARMCDSGIGSMHSDEGSRSTPKSIGKIMNKIDDSEFRMCKMSTSDNQSHETPYKPQVAPPRHQGGGSQNRGGFRNSSQVQSHSSRGNGSSFGRNSSGYSSGSSSGYNPSRSERSMSGQGQGRGRFDNKSANVSRPQVSSRTVSRGSTRCFYCKEPGHVARLCVRRQEEKNRLLRGATNTMANIDTEFENDACGNYEDIYNEQVEYLKN